MRRALSSGCAVAAIFFSVMLEAWGEGGAGVQPSGQPSVGLAARFDNPRGITHDASGNLYVVDTNNQKIRKIAPDGSVTTVAGRSRTPGSADGVRFDATFNNPFGITIDAGGNLYVADTGNNTIRKITPDGIVTTLAGAPGASGAADGTGTAARFNQPSGIAIDAAGNLYVTDTGNLLIRKITPAGSVSTLVGKTGVRGNDDGDPASATFLGPVGITADAAGNLYITDVQLDVTSPILTRDLTLIRKITVAGIVTTLAGSIAPPPPASNADGVGSSARFLGATGITINASGDLLFVADTENRIIRRVTLAGEVTTLPVPVPADSPLGTQFPSGITADAAGNLFFTDVSNAIVRRIAPDGTVTTIAGMAGEPGALDVP